VRSSRAACVRAVMLVIVACVCTTAATAAGATPSRAAAGHRVVRFQGLSVVVPQSWPVFDLAKEPQACVRFDRHAVYLGVPSARQSCPAHSVGHTEAVLLEPLRAELARAGARASVAGAISSAGSAERFTVPSAGVEVLATWGRHRVLVERALDRRLAAAQLPRAKAAGSRVRVRQRAHAAEALYGGLGFDTCTAPSSSAMSAWSASPYRAVGVYIGGVNSACAQPNLTAGWVANEVAGGWHLIPTYVGLQGAGACRGQCSTIDPSQASAQGAAAASEAVGEAQGLGIPSGNPIYYDMEQYTRGGANTSTVLAFLSAWTSQLHADGYLSGVYSSGSSGISDLVGAVGTGVTEPDDIWIADWNGEQTTSDPYVPAGDWSNHQRLHQYQGGHNETYGGVTIDIDNDYLDGATADTNGGGATPGSDNGGSRVVGVGSGRCLDVAGAGMANGSGVQLWDCNDGPQQHWVYSGGQLQVYGNYGKCLDADANSGGANGTRIQIYDCNGGSNQQWIAEPDGSLRSAAYGRCLDAVGGGSANGTALQLYDCNGAAWQHWIGPPAPNGGGRVQSLHSGRCLDVPGASISPGARVQLWDCNGGAQQQWVYEGTQLRVYGDKCLDAVGGGTTNGTPVQTWYCSGAPWQQWSWGPDGTIRSNASGRCLDAVGGGSGNGTTLQLWDCSGAPWQAWFRNTETTPTVSITSQPEVATTSGAATFAFTGADSGSPPVVFLCALDGAASSPCSSPASYSGLPVGTHTFTVWSQNMVGHKSPPATYTWKVGPTLSHNVLASKTRRSTSPLSRALSKCRKIKSRHKRARCIATAKKRYGRKHNRQRRRATRLTTRGRVRSA
jgi:Domain of unknown function (DUF1906)/Ricin-type beta-trefoil lectin domain